MLLSFGVSACGDRGPSTEELQQAFTTRVPEQWSVSSFKVEASENVGTKVEPIHKARIKSTLVRTSAGYTEERRERGVVFIREVTKAGEKLPVSTVAESRLKDDTWHTSIDLLSYWAGKGVPREYIHGKRVIVIGSEEEAAYLREKEALGLSGVWEGTYACSQTGGPASLRLTLTDNKGVLDATFETGPAKRNPNAPKASFRLSGKRDGSQISLEPGEWIETGYRYRLTSFHPVQELTKHTMVGTIDGETMKGRFDTEWCRGWEVSRTD